MTDPWATPDSTPPEQPGQEVHGQQPYGGYPMPGYYPPVKQSNGLALAGAITSFVPVVGLVLSIIGRVRAKALGGAGKTAGTVGIVLSILFTGGFGFAVYKLANSTAADPGCISAESAARGLTSTLSADESALSTAEQNQDSAAFTTAKNKFLADFQSLKADLDSAEAKSTHANVAAAIKSLDSDLANFNSEMQAAFDGSSSDTTTLQQTAAKMQSDGDALDSLCGNATNG